MNIDFVKNNIAFIIKSKQQTPNFNEIVFIESHDKNKDKINQFIILCSKSGLDMWKLGYIDSKVGENYRVKSEFEYVQGNLIDIELQAVIEKKLKLCEIPDNIYLSKILKMDITLKESLLQKEKENILFNINDDSRLLNNSIQYKFTLDDLKILFPYRKYYNKKTQLIEKEEINWDERSKGKIFHSDIKFYGFEDHGGFYKCGYTNGLRHRDVLINQMESINNFMSYFFEPDIGTNTYIYEKNSESELSKNINIKYIMRIYKIKLNSKKQLLPNLTLYYCFYDISYYKNNNPDPIVKIENHTIPLALVDENSEISQYGTYNHIFTIGNYVCKAFDYNKQCTPQDVEEFQCSREYTFIGQYFTNIFPFPIIRKELELPESTFKTESTIRNKFMYEV